MEVWCVLFFEALATTLWEVIIIVEDAACCVCCQMNLALLTQVC